jgi:hypothetical protein
MRHTSPGHYGRGVKIAGLANGPCTPTHTKASASASAARVTSSFDISPLFLSPSHYTFNLRDLAKVFQGMLMGDSKRITKQVSLLQ